MSLPLLWLSEVTADLGVLWRGPGDQEPHLGSQGSHLCSVPSVFPPSLWSLWSLPTVWPSRCPSSCDLSVISLTWRTRVAVVGRDWRQLGDQPEALQQPWGALEPEPKRWASLRLLELLNVTGPLFFPTCLHWLGGSVRLAGARSSCR